jgi:hypothetical protein
MENRVNWRPTKTPNNEDTVMAISLREINLQEVTLKIRGTSALIQHSWSSKGLREMRMTKAERALHKKQNPPKTRNPEEEAEDATHRMKDGGYCVPVTAIKASIISAAHKDLGIEKTAVKKSLFLIADEGDLVRMTCSEPIVREDIVRIGMGSTDLRYRPQFDDWEVEITAQVDADILSADILANLVKRAGFGVGIGEWRPEKGGDFGRFEIDQEFGIKFSGGNK